MEQNIRVGKRRGEMKLWVNDKGAQHRFIRCFLFFPSQQTPTTNKKTSVETEVATKTNCL
jgi:hypothetical protein